MFDKIKFKELLEKARGNRTIQKYAEESGVSRAYISKYINLRLDNPPNPDVIKRLADAAYNGITYEDLMEAAGYIQNSDVIDEAIKDDPDLERIWNMLNNREEVRLMFKKIANLKPADVKRILKIIEIVEEEDSASLL